MKKKVKEVNPSVEIIGQYTTQKEKILVGCNVCNYQWYTPAGVILGGHSCPKCSHAQGASKIKKSRDVFVKELSATNPNIQILGDYINDSTKVKCKCCKCNQEWNATPNNLLRGSGCPSCNISKGENKISTYLTDRKISFIQQYCFNDCADKRKLPFDFYLPQNNTAVEYDGQLHYMSIDYFGGDEQLKNRKRLDNIKTSYCQANGIKLIRIPYWEFDNIESILEKELEAV